MRTMYGIFLHKYTVFEGDGPETCGHNFEIYCVINTLDEAYQNALLRYDTRLDELKKKFPKEDYYGEMKTEEYVKTNERSKFKIGYLVSGFMDKTYEEIWLQKMYMI